MSSPNLVSIPQAAEALGMTRQRLGKESRDHADFPIHPVDGRRLVDVSEVRRWRENNIRVRKEMAIAPRHPWEEVVDLQTSLVTLEDVDTDPEDSPWAAAKYFPADVLAKLKPADYQSLADVFNAAITHALEVAALASGSPLKRRAMRCYFDDLWSDISGDGKPMDLAERLAVQCWAAGRFPGKNVLLPATSNTSDQ